MAFVYVIGVLRNPVKVGKAIDVASRLAGLQIGCPDKLTVHHSVFVRPNFLARVEAAAHAELKEHHRQGEWFNVDADEAHAAILKVLPIAIEERAREILAKPRDELEHLLLGHKVDILGRAAISTYRRWGADARYAKERQAADEHIIAEAGPATHEAFRRVVIEHRHGLPIPIREAAYDGIEALVNFIESRRNATAA